MNISQALQNALARHQAGDLDTAERLYRDILKKKPKLADAHNLLGVLLQQKGDIEGAITHTQRATELDPKFHVPHVNLGNALQAAGRTEDAVIAFRRADRLAPGQAEILNNLASALNETGAYEEALAAAAEAMRANPNLGEAYNNEGNALLGLGRPKDALTSFDRALALGAPPAEVWFNRAQASLDLDDPETALKILEQLAKTNPDDPRLEFNRGKALYALDRFDDAAEVFRHCLVLSPDDRGAHSNLAGALQAGGRLGEAIEAWQAAIRSDPDDPVLTWNLALAQLQVGDDAAGWANYEARWDMPGFQNLRRTWVRPNWRGEDIAGRTLLIRAEQGFGDAIRMARFFAQAGARAGRVIVECRKPLVPLFRAMPGLADVIALGDDLPHHDVQVPMMSLPLALNLTRGTIPAEMPYLAVPEGATPDPRIADASGFKVGIVWAGSPTRQEAGRRDAPLELFEDLFRLPGARFFSLQVGPFAADLAARANGPEVVDLAGSLGDFAVTAACVQALDLVITVDTAVLHLTAALDKPVWGLMSRPTGYLWGTDGARDPWYPKVCLHRQPAPGDWAPVFDAVKADLEKLIP